MHDPDRKFILDGLRNGFKLITESDPSLVDGYDNYNYASATCFESKPDVDDIFLKEVDLGCISRVSTKPRCIHSIGRVPKRDSGKSRPIMGCSGPHGFSLYDHIKRDLESFWMNSIDTAVCLENSTILAMSILGITTYVLVFRVLRPFLIVSQMLLFA